MNNRNYTVHDLEAANNGCDSARWKIIETYEEDIRKVSKGNRDLEHYIIVELFDLFDTLNNRYISYLNS